MTHHGTWAIDQTYSDIYCNNGKWYSVVNSPEFTNRDDFEEWDAAVQTAINRLNVRQREYHGS